ncbi:MAG: DUF3570 domain-containing protein [Bradymonadaceae bacterium]|nr:DUF3570 domain-containing protein [Lujinxingiaceae bacterium]
MQLSAGIGVCLLLVASGCATSERARVAATYQGFSDASVEVSSPQLVASAPLGESLDVSTHWATDVITAATPLMSAPDTITRATQYQETRHEGGAAVRWRPLPRTELGSRYILSLEPDYQSHTGALSASRELFDRHATLGVGARLGLDRVLRADVSAFDEQLTIVAGELAWTQILSPRLVGHIVYSVEHRKGYQANPYRLVPIYERDLERPSLVMSEAVPAQRTRHASELLGIWSATPSLALRAAYRLYLDDWRMRSHTARLEAWQTLWEDLVRLRLRLRGYTQQGAHFYQQHYVDPVGLRSGDHRLSTMNSFGAGLRLDFRPKGFVLSTSYDATLYRFAEYAVRDRMLGHLFILTLSMEFVP